MDQIYFLVINVSNEVKQITLRLMILQPEESTIGVLECLKSVCFHTDV